MSVNRRKKQPNKKSAITASLKTAGQRRYKSVAGRLKSWCGRYPVFLFLAGFTVLWVLFHIIMIFTPFSERCYPYYIDFNAQLSGRLLKLLGQDITVRNASIYSPAFAVTIKLGCDALEPIVLFICAVLAFPAAFLKKAAGLVTGIVFLIILNLIRIVTLFLVGVYLPRAFQIMHVDVWQGLFIFFAILFWMLWILWTGKSQILIQHRQVQSMSEPS